MVNAIPEQKKPSVVEMAKKQRHIHLYEKISSKKPLSRSELKELSKYEEKEPEPGLLDTQEQIAKAFGVRLRTVEYWVKDGMPVCADGKYDIKDIQAWRFTRKNNQGGKPTDKKSLAYWDTQYREYKARKEQILYRKHIGELIERKKVEDEMISLFTAIKRSFLSLPRAVAPTLAGLEPREVESQLAVKVKEIINFFAKEKIFEEDKKVRKNAKNRKTKNMERPDKGGLGIALGHDGLSMG